MNVGFVPLHQVDETWPFISKFINDGITYNPGAFTGGDMWTMCRRGDAFLMIGADSVGFKMAAVWRFETWREDRVFNCLCLGGRDIKDWLADAIKAATEQAAMGGANKLTAAGRAGWAKAITNAKPIYTVFEVEI